MDHKLFLTILAIVLLTNSSQATTLADCQKIFQYFDEDECYTECPGTKIGNDIFGTAKNNCVTQDECKNEGYKVNGNRCSYPFDQDCGDNQITNSTLNYLLIDEDSNKCISEAECLTITTLGYLDSINSKCVSETECGKYGINNDSVLFADATLKRCVETCQSEELPYGNYITQKCMEKITSQEFCKDGYILQQSNNATEADDKEYECVLEVDSDCEHLISQGKIRVHMISTAKQMKEHAINLQTCYIQGNFDSTSTEVTELRTETIKKISELSSNDAIGVLCESLMIITQSDIYKVVNYSEL